MTKWFLWYNLHRRRDKVTVLEDFMKSIYPFADEAKSGRQLRCAGQVVVEYVMFLAATLVLILALVFLMRAVGDHGHRTVERVGYEVP